MPPRPMTLPWLLCCAALSTGCGPEPLTELRIERPEVPAGLLTCAPEPAVPPPEATQRDVALYLLDLGAAYDDCRGRLEAVRGLLGADP